MAEFTIEKRVVISADPAALAESVAARFVHRLAKCSADGRARACRRSPAGRWARAVLAAAAPSLAPRPRRLVARALLVGRRAVRPARRRRPQREAGARGAAGRPRHSRGQHPRGGRRATRGSTWMPPPTRYAAELARFPQADGTAVAVVRHLLPRSRTGRAHRVAVPRPAGDPDHRRAPPSQSATPPSRRRSA